MESESGAKIAIRGKGSVKEGKGRSDAAHSSNQEEDLHCLVMADTEDKINKAKQLIHNVIETVSSPTTDNQARKVLGFTMLTNAGGFHSRNPE
jgi:splicing factor 1